MTQVYLVRHAQAEGDLYYRVHGKTDSRLTRLGKAQAAALGKRFSSLTVDAVYSSELTRALVTAGEIAEPKALQVRVDQDLGEIGLGCFEDKTYGELAYRFPDARRLFVSCSPNWAPQGGERFQQVAARMTAAFFRIAHAHPEQTILLLSHSSAIRCLQAALAGRLPWEPPLPEYCGNTGVSLYQVQGHRFRVVFENDLSHLSRDLLPSHLGTPPLVWFQPTNLEQLKNAKLYYEARQDAWAGLHGSLTGFDGPGFLEEARQQLQWDPRALQQVMFRGQSIGFLQAATLQGAKEGAGHISFFYLKRDYRGRGIGTQLLGQAVSLYRPMGRTYLRLLCDPRNGPAQRFYQRHGFEKTSRASGALGPLDVLEMKL